MIDINCSMITKTKMNWNLYFVVSKFKAEYWDNTKSKENNNKNQGGCEKLIQWKSLDHRVDIDIKI